MSPNGPEQAGVDAEQRRIDALDHKQDRKVDVGATDRTPEELGELYLNKTNDLQGKIRDLQRQADVLRDKRDPNWQTLENSCIETEQGLLSLLKTIDEKNVSHKANEFTEQVLRLTTKIEAAKNPEDIDTEESEKPIPRSIQDIFESMLEPQDEETKAECVKLAADASLHYTDADIRLVQSRLRLFEALSPELMQSLFPNQKEVPSAKDVAYQLARGLLGVSQNAFLMANPGPEDVIRAARERGIDELKSAEQVLIQKKNTLDLEIGGLAKQTKEEADDTQIERNVKMVERAQKEVQDIQQKMQSTGARVTELDLALVRLDVASARNNASDLDADRTLSRVKEQYAETLQVLDPALALEASKAQESLTLSPVEKALQSKGGKRPGEAVRIAVEEARKSAAEADILDQVQKRTVMNFSKIVQSEQFFGEGPVKDVHYKDKSTFFRSYAYVNVIDANGRTKTVALTPAAQKRIESLPADCKPVLLKNVSPLSFQTSGQGFRGTLYTKTVEEFGASVLDSKDIGTTTNEGHVLDAENQPIDMNTDPRASIAREQIGKQKSFSISDYKRDPQVHLLTVDGSLYEKHLINIHTASGKTYEGLTISVDAFDILNKPAPNGMTLVLKREPGSILLREKELVGNGGRAKMCQRVLDADMLRTSDFAYAKLSGDELEMTDVIDPTKTEKKSASDLVRKREEDGRDIVRAMDQSDSIKQTTSAASAIGESMSHLQALMTAGDEGTKRQAMVDFARNEAEPMLNLLRDPSTMRNVDLALSELHALKQANLGVALGDIEKEIDARIQSLQQFAELLRSDRVATIFETIMDKSKFDADTWGRWFSTDFPKIMAAIVVTTLIVGSIVFTCGGATPLWAVSATTLKLMVTAGTASGVLLGSELGAEGVRLGRYLFDDDVGGKDGEPGRLAYSNRSRLLAYAEGQEMLDPATGKKVPMEFLKNVASPYAQEFAISFITTYATLGLASVAATRLSLLAQNSKWVQALATKSPTANRIMSYLSQITDDAARVGPANASFMRQWGKQILNETFEEVVVDQTGEAAITQLDQRLGPLAGFFLTVARGFKPLKVPARVGTFLGTFAALGTTNIADAQRMVQAQGYPSVTVVDGTLNVTDHEGNTFHVVPDAATTNVSQANPSVVSDSTVAPEAVDSATPETVAQSAEDSSASVTEAANTETKEDSPGTADDPASESSAAKTRSQATANDVSTNMKSNNVGLIGARNRTGASPEVTQEAASILVNDRIALAKSVANPQRRSEAIARYNQLLKAQGGKELSEGDIVRNCEKFVNVVAGIENGSIGLEGKYIGSSIRDLHQLMPGIDMEAKQSLCRKLHESSMKNENAARIARAEKPFENMNQYMEWLCSPDQTIAGGRPVTPNGEFDAKDVVQLGTNPEVSARLAPVVDAMKTLADDPNTTFTRAQVEQVLAANPELDSVDRTILLETATLLEGIEAKAGDTSLPAAERWKILEFSARYVQDFRASPEFNATPQQLLNLVADNAINLSHQNIMDHMTLVGSSHGTLHVLRGNSEMLSSLYGQMGFTPAMRVLAMQATFDHDMGYTKRTLLGKRPNEGVFESSKDHPLESTLFVESKSEAYEQIFGREGYVTIRNAVLDHSDSMGTSDRQYADYATKLDLIADQNAPAADRVAAAVALVDCLATVSNLKASPLFKNNPEIVATMARIEQIHIQINAKLHEQKTSKNPSHQISQEIADLRDEATYMRLAMQDRIEQMQDIPADTRLAYLIALESTMQFENNEFAITSNLGMLAASVSPVLTLDPGGKIHATFTVDINGLATISRALDPNALDPKTVAEAATSGIGKTAKDFGKLTPDSHKALDTFVMHAGNLESKNAVDRAAAEAYFVENNGTISLETNSRLIIDVKVGKNPEYEASRVAVENALRVDAIRGLARANIDKLVNGEPITIDGVDGNSVELRNATALQTYAESSLAKYIRTLPPNYVMENARGQYVPVVQAFNEAKDAAISNPVTWQQFADRMMRTAGSNAPLQSTRIAS